ncbi:EAL domain-containing protein [Botrimarina hoheduenensis]|uniref:Putative cyclic di-GMP phosphodiesterase YliE n=1 Tax=Botrimarina hoheduenensis TaxID=2528000 RepID=A0A5C5VSM2_9BACT|nr:EAL domain-containing protein [Botrimarina hoheduenensis]TWT41634.1 putative cyclic di-GMP phosphodiesterase YliE [Botrimarina hoheduenensis]
MNVLDSATDRATWLLSGQISDDEPMRQISIDVSPFSVGRRPDQKLTIPSATVSGSHAEMRLDEAGRLIVRDLGSTNGTFVNGERVTESCVVNHGDLVQFAQVVFRVGQNVQSHHSQTVQDDSADRALSLIQFDKLMTERAVVPHFQPIVSIKGRATLGYEILGRSRLFGLTDPHTMFSAAAVLNLESELSRIFREEGLAQSTFFPPQAILFANTHPNEIDEPELLEFSLRELREASPNRPLVLEIHEGTATQTSQMRELRAKLNDLNIGLAYDDFGAGQARLIELVEVPPDYLKFDMKLVQNLSVASPERQKMVGRLVQMTRELGIIPLAEGIETEADHLVCQELGFLSAQGYLYGKPAMAKTFTS